MKKLLTLVLPTMLCALFATVAALAQSGGNAKQELAAIYELQDKAIMGREAKTITAYYAPDYVAKIKQEIFRRAESVRNLENFFSTTSEISLSKTFLEKTEPDGETQIAFVRRLIKGTMIFAGGKTRGFEINSRAEEHWTKNAKGAWLMRVGVEREQTLKIDGLDENADVLESSRTAIEAIYEQIDFALKTQNVRAMFVHWAADFTEINNGKESKSDEIETAFSALFDQVTKVSNVVSQINNIKTVDRNYVVEMKRIIQGEMILKGKTVLFEYSYQAQETWVSKEQEAWKLKTSKILTDKFLINGKETK